MTSITSPTNEHFKRWCDLATAKGIRRHGEFILMGEKLIKEFLTTGPGSWKIRAEIFSDQHQSLWIRNSRHQADTPKAYQLSTALFKEVDVLGTHFNLLVLEAPDWQPADLEKEPKGLELICPLGDPSNLGALARSAVAFGIRSMVLTMEAAHPLHPKAVKASAGAVLKMNFSKFGPLKDYRSKGETWALQMGGKNLHQMNWPDNLRLMIGEEGPGLPEISGVTKVGVETESVESLNATVAASIALYDFSRHRS